MHVDSVRGAGGEGAVNRASGSVEARWTETKEAVEGEAVESSGGQHAQRGGLTCTPPSTYTPP